MWEGVQTHVYVTCVQTFTVHEGRRKGQKGVLPGCHTCECTGKFGPHVVSGSGKRPPNKPSITTSVCTRMSARETESAMPDGNE